MFIIKIFYFWAKNKVNTVNVNMLNQTKIIANHQNNEILPRYQNIIRIPNIFSGYIYY